MAATPHCASLDFAFAPKEYEVAQILLEFSKKSVVYLGFIPVWTLRRKRSALVSPPESSASVPSPPSKKVKESSPTSPLVLNSLPLSRSESDEHTNAKHAKKKPSLDKKSQFVEAIDELTKQNQGLKGEFEAMKQHYNHLKAINSELKAKKQEMILGSNSSKNESAIPEIGTSSSAMEVVKLLTVESSTHQPAPMAEQSNNGSQNFQIPIGGIPFYDPSSLSPMGIPDLNISLEEINQRNYSRFMAARARKNRIQICKNKNNGVTKLQTPPNNPCM